MRFICLLLLLCGWHAQAATIDQIAITIGRHVITESQIDEELRVTALLNQAPVQYSAEQRRSAAGRLIDQVLIKDEMELTRYPAPDTATVNEALTKVQALYASPEAFAGALHDLQLDPDDVRQHLAAQIATVRFVTFRFRPDAGISDGDVDEAYKRKLATRKAQDPLPSRADVRRTMIEERTDEALDDWLGRARKQSRIVFLDKDLESAGHG